MNFKKISVEDITQNEIYKAIREVKQRIYSIVYNELLNDFAMRLSIKSDSMDDVEKFIKTLANKHASSMMGDDYAVTRSLTHAHRHVSLAYENVDDEMTSEEHFKTGVDTIDKVNATIQKETNRVIRMIKGCIETRNFDFDKLLTIDGIGWANVSMMYLSIADHQPIDKPFVKAFIKHQVLTQEAEQNQKLWLKESEIRQAITSEFVDKVFQLTDNPRVYLNELVDDLLIDTSIVRKVEMSSMHTGEIGYAHAEYYDQFRYMFEALHKRSQFAKPMLENLDDMAELERIVAEVEDEQGIKYNLEQLEGIYGACQNPIFTMMGKAGTGKSASVRAVVEIFNRFYRRRYGREVMGTAFTGRATYSLKQSVGFDGEHCATLHRWMAYNDYMEDEANPFPKYDDVKLLIIDEFSMVELKLINRVLGRLRENEDVNILFVGDIGQLPAINLGFAMDFIQSNIGQRIQYTQVVRQAKDSIVPRMANKVYDGIVPDELIDPNVKIKNFSFISAIGHDSMVKMSANVYMRYIEKFDDSKGMQILTNTRNLVSSINEYTQECMKKRNMLSEDEYYITETYNVHTGDRIVFLKNIIHLETGVSIFNGAVGTVKEIASKTPKAEHYIADVESITIEFDAEDIGEVTFTNVTDVTRNITLAYATTTHKSQGSTIPNVILAVGRANRLNSRQLVYAGMTRTAKTLTLVSSPNVICDAVETDAYIHARTIYKDIIKEINQMTEV